MYRVNEIFYSIQGEASGSGLPSVFVRFSGCNLRCRWCDTPRARSPEPGRDMSCGEILEEIKKFPSVNVCVTGGEPLFRKDIGVFIARLLSSGYRVSVETNGSLDISALRALRRGGKRQRGARVVMDLKCPSSGESGKNNYGNLKLLGEGDDLKFVVLDRKDYLWARKIILERRVPRGVNVFISPVHGKLSPVKVAGWMLEDGLDARLQLQLHKLLKIR